MNRQGNNLGTVFVYTTTKKKSIYSFGYLILRLKFKPIMRFIFLLFLALICFSNVFSQDMAKEYIDKFSPMAVEEMERTGIPASIKLAQGLLESDYGRSELAIYANNHFGIKCNGRWVGRTYFKEDDDKDEDGKLIESCFRVFDSESDSYRSHSEFLLENSRYDFLFDYASNDYESWAKGLQKSGYATDPHYPKKLLKIIEKYQLHHFDNGGEPMMASIHEEGENKSEENVISFEEEANNTTSSQKKQSNDYTKNDIDKKEGKLSTIGSKLNRFLSDVDNTANTFFATNEVENEEAEVEEVKNGELVPEEADYNGVKVHIAKSGESIVQIAQRYKKDVRYLVRCNDYMYKSEQKLAFGDRIYLEPKANKYAGLKDQHQVRRGEKMAEIAQMYGIKESSLRKMNRLGGNAEPKPGEILSLKSTNLLSKPRTLAKETKTKDEEVEYIFPENVGEE